MSCPSRAPAPSCDSSRSAGGQLEQPWEVKSSTTTGCAFSAPASKALPSKSAASAAAAESSERVAGMFLLLLFLFFLPFSVLTSGGASCDGETRRESLRFSRRPRFGAPCTNVRLIGIGGHHGSDHSSPARPHPAPNRPAHPGGGPRFRRVQALEPQRVLPAARAHRLLARHVAYELQSAQPAP